jgi:AAA family ATP:ADP antiporter
VTPIDTANPGVFAQSMRTAFRIEPAELRATLLSFFFMLTLMASYYLLRPIRDAMSSNWSDAELSTLFSATFLFSIVAVMIYGVACSRVRFRRLVPGVYALFALSFVAFYFAVGPNQEADWARKSFYVWISVFSLFHVSVFWSYMADIFSREQAPRLFGFIASGASIGAILGPLIAVTTVGVVGAGNLLLVSASLLVIPIVVIGTLERGRSTSTTGGTGQQDDSQIIGGNPFAGFTLFLKNPYLLAIGLFILLYTALSTFVYFELKNLLAGLEEVVRIRVWAGMDLAVNILAIGTAMFGTGRLTTRFGLTTTLVLVPVLIVAGLLIVAIAPMISVVVGLQVIRRAGNYAITRPGREMLFTVVDRETRFKAKSVIDIVVYRGGDAATAWAFTGLTQGLGLGLGAVAAVGAGIAVLWSFVALFLGRRYASSRNDKPEVAEQEPG